MRRVRLPRLPRSFLGDRRGSSAVEFAIVSVPFIFTLLFIVQMAIYYMAQSSLDAGVIQTADYLVNLYNSASTPSVTASSLKTLVYSKSSGMVKNDSTFLVDLKEFTALASAPVAISNVVDANSPGDVLALRAQGTVVTFMPGFTSLATVRSSALIRRQGY
ncbi:MAG: pilus assembly protein [Beijerinckiaceae bacterium]|nr:pilus assembly protein [Beijerinckiaceae bacterium]